MNETPDSVLATYEASLNQAGYVIFKYDGKWYYNEIEATDDLCDGPYNSRAEVLLSACRTQRLLDKAA